MKLKGKIKNIYKKEDFHIITLISGKKIQYIGETKIIKGDYIICEGDYKSTKYGETFFAKNLEIDTNLSFIMPLVINGISEKKAEEIFELYSYEEIKINPLLIYDFFLTDSARNILEQIQNVRDLFTEETIETIPKNLAKEIKGIGKKKIEQWLEIFTTYYEFNAPHFLSDKFLYYILSSDKTRGIVSQIPSLNQIEEDYLQLKQYNVPDYSLKYLLKDYKEEMMEVIKDNPFILIDEYYVPFYTVDNLAQCLFGLEEQDETRVIYGVLYVLSNHEKEGNTFMPKEQCLMESAAILDLDSEYIMEVISENLKLGNDSEFMLDGEMLYRRVIYHTEQKLARIILEKSKAKDNFVPYSIFQYLKTTKLSVHQQECILGSISKKISIFTGGPGTGKTTSINELCNCLDKMGKKYLLASPTGKAAKRISESTGKEASTIYRLLEYKSRGKFGSFQRNENYKLFTDYIIVDESSMLDVYILNALLNATNELTSIIFVGDVDQLPSVSMGSVFKDMKESGALHVYELTEVFRQGQDSGIIQNAYHVKNNEPLQMGTDDFNFKKIRESREVEEFLEEIEEECLILTPMKVGAFGTIKINKLMQELKNPNPVICSHFDRNFKVGDKVIQLDNNYDKEIYNGEIGYIKSGNRNEITVCYPNNLEHFEITYEYKELNQIDLAYAITIHKSQGSEAENVIMVIDGNPDFISKEMIYTGITRAKKKLIMLSTYELDFYEKLETSNDRCTNLCKILKKTED